jgi:acyl-coenzyme A synthetase/AMP-(fatty) acid ligase/aryl carrier-like protein
VPSDVASDGFALTRSIAERRPTVMQATPTTWRMLFAAGWTGNRDLKVLCGGEALDRDLADKLAGCCKEVWNLYGPTETTIWSSLDRIRQEEPVTIGRPIANTRFYVLDKRRQPVAPGTPGELYIGGDGVARCYHGRPDLTRERFLADPFAAGRVFRTGDLVRQLSDGRVAYVGRLDEQIKLRGHRIELGEIESRLREHSAVRDAVVALREASPGDRRLIAYIRPAGAPDALPTADILRHLRSALPDYMVPSAFAVIERIPLTPSGKVDRQALPDDLPTMPADEPPAAPATTLEQTVGALWRDVLGARRFGADENFFDAGGNSLHLLELVARLRSATGIALSTVEMFEHATVRTMARHLERRLGEDGNLASADGPTAPDLNALKALRRRRR